MKISHISCLALLVFCLSASNLQARLAVILEQKEAAVLSVKSDRRMLTGDYVTYILGNDEVAAKASSFEGQRVHILYYEAGNDKYCVDLRPAGEPAFEIMEVGNTQTDQRLY
jgi:hypothetical protein